MSVWDDQPTGSLNRRPANVGQGSSAASTARRASHLRAHDDVRVAAQRDAAEVIARARRDIQQIVADARREIQEITAQVHAADVELSESALPDPGTIEYQELPVLDADAWLGSPAAEAEPTSRMVRSATMSSPTVAAPAVFSAPPGYLSPVPARLPPSGPVRTFVALFTLAGLVVLTGTVWWLGRNPAGFAPTARPVPPEAAAGTQTMPSLDPAAALTPPPVPSSVPEGLLVQIDVQRSTWIRTTVDGDVDAGRTYDEGESIKIEGGTEVSVRAGDAGGLLVSVNGGPNRPFGPNGVALTRRFSRVTAPASDAASTPRGETPPTALGAPVAALPTPAPSPAGPPPVAPRTSAEVAAPGPTVPPPASPLPSAPTAPSAANGTSAPPPSQPGVRPESSSPPPPASAAVEPPSGARGTAPVRMDIAASARQWMDAYHRQDRAAMQSLTAPSLAINDERRATQRFPFGLEVTRAFEEEELHLSGDSAIFNARMTERASTGSIVSRVSQTWVRRLGQWQLQEARILADAAVSSAVR